MAHIMKMTMRAPDDMHVHLREKAMLDEALPYTTRVFRRALVMPNLAEPITTGEQAKAYRDRITTLHNNQLEDQERYPFEPLMTIKLTQETTADTIRSAAKEGVVAVKLYPEGVTTNSHGGVRNLDGIDFDVFRVMSELGVVLCVHAEEPGVFSMDREKAYLHRIGKISQAHPSLKIVIEHVTTEDAITFVATSKSNIAATITAHHLVLTLDDVVGDKINPHNFCKPIAKKPADRDAILKAALSGSSKFFFGSDSAPHRTDTKECGSGCAGCFTAPLAIELLADTFDKNNSLHNLEAFTSKFGADFYDIPLNEGEIYINREKWTIPKTYGSVVPFMAGQILNFKVV